ncbi:hypothetical protein BC829DRAFT_419386 [Chytridium lagenaria]|nr:hypothetical protein BC829DRAFT_419386 [Chytridium lagenaria]
MHRMFLPFLKSSKNSNYFNETNFKNAFMVVEMRDELMEDLGMKKNEDYHPPLNVNRHKDKFASDMLRLLQKAEVYRNEYDVGTWAGVKGVRSYPPYAMDAIPSYFLQLERLRSVNEVDKIINAYKKIKRFEKKDIHVDLDEDEEADEIGDDDEPDDPKKMINLILKIQIIK